MNIVFKIRLSGFFMVLLSVTLGPGSLLGQERAGAEEAGLGPVVSAYLGYLRSEQEVVDDRVSRKEISRGYYRRNSNRIRALREMAIRIARESQNDYLPELEAVAGDEFGTLLERPPNPSRLRVGEVLNSTLRYLGVVRFGENFYLFARLDPYEQTELRKKSRALGEGQERPAKGLNSSEVKTRPRRIHHPQ